MAAKSRPPEFFTRVLGPEEQGQGSFDGGSIVEQKMIGFSGEGSRIHRIGPLYYWAWGECHKPLAEIGMHPHRGFEIMSYVLRGEIEHQDTLGHRSRIGPGGVQLMKTGSGVEHDECFVTTPAESFQIWLDPDFREEIKRPPQYEAYPPDQFPLERLAEASDSIVKIILGPKSPIVLGTPQVEMQELKLVPKQSWTRLIQGLRGWSAIVVNGHGQWLMNDKLIPVKSRDYLVHQSEHPGACMITAESELRLVWIEVPLVSSYHLFHKAR